MPVITLHGKCYCCALEFEAVASGEPTVIHCHCNECREWTGGIAYSAVPCASVTFTKGTPKTFKRPGGPEKSFCEDCGTGIMNSVTFGPVKYTVAAGLFKESGTLQTQLHCQLRGRIPWADCSADGKPAFEGFPGPKDVKC
eukprot:TRINITY_DN36823_c0_g1_i1.p1 TRINITY_DN36823_c0_g1~~TRINITY_DN36823_c0_g1_i1.p1  ORF type:complete len:141 (+),score=18.39 TRINITY_DN36823_c0_g1_i1:68-490(+)